MTRQEAIAAMREGKKVRHLYFSEEEWITMENGEIVTEEGYSANADEFWYYRRHENFNDNWSIVE